MEPWIQMILTFLGAFIASSGFWAYIQRKGERKDASTNMLIGLGHDRVVFLGMCYIERGWITQDEFENLHVYLYEPYKAMGGNGSADKVMREVANLPIYKAPKFENIQRSEIDE